ncbi:MAG: sulfatase-like hydrolase/transferase [Acidobacteriota bacterium]
MTRRRPKTVDADAAPPKATPGPSAALQIVGLWSVAVAQPLFDQLGRNVETLAAHRLAPAEVFTLTALLAGLLALPLAALPWLGARLHRSLGLTIQSLLTIFLVGILTLEGLRELPASWAVGIALAVGAAVAFCARRFQAVGLFLSLLAGGALLFPVSFLLDEDVRPLCRTPEASTLPFAEGETPPPDPPSVIWVMFDELPLTSLLEPDGTIDVDLFPNFAELATVSLWARSATTVASHTNYAVPALITGRFPTTERPPAAAAYPRTLFTWLAASHRLDVHETYTWLCPPDLCGEVDGPGPVGRINAALADLGAVFLHLVVPLDFAGGLPDLGGSWRDFWGDPDAPERARGSSEPFRYRRFLEGLGTQGGPALHYLHVKLPHRPWMHLPSGLRYQRAGSPRPPWGLLQGGRWIDDPWPATQAFQRHLLQLRYCDRLLGELMDTLRRTGLWEEAVIVVTSDHGVSFRPGAPYRKADGDLAADLVRIPLFVRGPGLEPRIDDTNVESIDLLPTLADLTGRRIPWGVDGRSLVGGASERADKRFWNVLGDRLDVPLVLSARPELGPTPDRIDRIFPGDDPLRLFAVGPWPELVGRPVSTLPHGPPSTWVAELAAPEDYVDIDPESGFVPALVRGSLRAEGAGARSAEVGAGDSAPRHLAVAVDGTVWGLTEPFVNLRKEARFAALVPEQALGSGRHRIEVLALVPDPDGGPPSARPLTVR